MGCMSMVARVDRPWVGAAARLLHSEKGPSPLPLAFAPFGKGGHGGFALRRSSRKVKGRSKSPSVPLFQRGKTSRRLLAVAFFGNEGRQAGGSLLLPSLEKGAMGDLPFAVPLARSKANPPLSPFFKGGRQASSLHTLFQRGRQKGDCSSLSPPLEKGATGDLPFAVRRARSKAEANPPLSPFSKGGRQAGGSLLLTSLEMGEDKRRLACPSSNPGAWQPMSPDAHVRCPVVVRP